MRAVVEEYGRWGVWRYSPTYPSHGTCKAMNPPNQKTPDFHHRRSIRLKEFDYSLPGAFFVTICTHQREHLFGEIVNEVMVLNGFGRISREEWQKTALIRSEIELGEFVIMPNHFHGIIWIVDGRGTARCRGTARRAPTGVLGETSADFTPTYEQFGKSVVGSIPTIVRAFKSAVSRRINLARGTPGRPVWQRNYWEHIIRDEQDLHNAQAYILNNPAQWESDELHSRGII